MPNPFIIINNIDINEGMSIQESIILKQKKVGKKIIKIMLKRITKKKSSITNF